MANNSWLGGTPTFGQILSIPKSEEVEIKRLAEALGMYPENMISLIISSKLQEWQKAENIDNKASTDLMLAKLSRS
jgi:hypothetical protein